MNNLDYLGNENYLNLNEYCDTQFNIDTMSSEGSSISNHSYNQFSPDPKNVCHLEIAEEPADYRFRYRKEKYHGFILGFNSPSSKKKGLVKYPQVKLHHFEGGEAVVRCWLMTAGSPGPHFHQLACQINKKNTIREPIDITLTKANDYTATYKNLFIIHGVKTDKDDLNFFREKLNKFPVRRDDVKVLSTDNKEAVENIDKNLAVLYFEVYDVQNRKFLCHAVSRSIKNLHNAKTGILKITRCFQNYGSCEGGDEVVIFVEKVTKDVKIRFFEKDKFTDNVWIDYAKFTSSDIHHQVAIAFRTPPYKDRTIMSDTKVYFELFREEDSEVSEPVEFTYRPTVLFKPVSCGKKRKLLDSPSNQLEQCIQPFNLPPNEMNTLGGAKENGLEIRCVPVSPQLPPDSSTSVLSDPFLYSPGRQENYICGQMCSLEDRASFLFPDTTQPSSLDKILESDNNLSFLEDYDLCPLEENELCFDVRLRSDSEEESEEDNTNKEINKNEVPASKDRRETHRESGDKESGQRLAADSLLIHPPRQVQTSMPSSRISSVAQMARHPKREMDLLSAIFVNKDIVVINNLLKSAEINQVDKYGNSALHIAAKSGKACYFDLLFKHNIDRDLRNIDGDDVLLCAARYNKTDSVKVLILVHKFNPNVQNLKNKETSLHLAVENNNVELVKCLLQRGADPNIPNRSGCTPHDLTSLNECDLEIKNMFSQYVLKGIRNRLQRLDLFFECHDVVDEASTDTEDEGEFSSANDDSLTEELDNLRLR